MENETQAAELIQSRWRIDSVYTILVPHTVSQICFSVTLPF